MSEQKKIIEYRAVDIRHGRNTVLKNVTFSVEEGEFLYVIGKIGSGKTSLIRTLIGEWPVRTGSAEVVGFNLRRLKNRQIPYLRRRLGVIFQDFQLLMDRTVEENLSFVLRATGWNDSRKIRERISTVIEQVNMASSLRKMPHQLSGGEQQRVAIARAILNKPSLILADEPTGNLDSETTHQIMELLLSIHRENHSAVMMITHNMEICRRYPFRTLICKDSLCQELEQSPTEIDFVF
ncbi:MAG: ATP-binding cassette domain-containing protein [Alistipes sp.]|nr:ATP-binding cassette domain-containing protein [Candidatus Minthomonas equi]